MPRIIAGSLGGLKLSLPKRVHLRPTQDRIKEVIFSSLGDAIVGARVLDLYAGIGSLGIEALSRGASSATFVEQNPACVSAIRENLSHCRLEAEIIPTRVEMTLKQPCLLPYNFIFIDPPYEKQRGSLDEDPLLIMLPSWLNQKGRVIWEHYAQQTFSKPAGWNIIRHKTYGETGLTFLEYAG